MTEVRRSVTSDEVRQDRKHVLFVEGGSDAAIDPRILGPLMRNRIRVEPLGSSFHVRSVAEALHAFHPYYYFIVDGDHHDQAFVNSCWQNFPDPATANLLMWYRKELENYFLIPEYLLKSPHLSVSEDELRQRILDCCRSRLYLDAANRVIVRIRETQKIAWVRLFERVADFSTEGDALIMLTSLAAWRDRKVTVGKMLNKTRIERLFGESLAELTGGVVPIDFGNGLWLQLMKGKKILPTLANQCFQVQAADGRILQGPEKVGEVARRLAHLPLTDQPDDFQRLASLIEDRIKST
jgi:hypothetical protein